MNKKQRDDEYDKLYDKQHGEYCNGCGAIPHPTVAKYKQPKSTLEPFYIVSKKGKFLPLEIDHIDGDSLNIILENEQFMCPSCNNIKKPRKRMELSERPKTAEMQRGDLQEDNYRSWLNRQVAHERDFITDEEAIYGGAEWLTNFSAGETISPVTTRRYLKKLTSSVGIYYWYKGFIGLKSKLVNLEEYLNEVQRKKGRKVKKLEEFVEAYQKDFGPLNNIDED